MCLWYDQFIITSFLFAQFFYLLLGLFSISYEERLLTVLP